MGAVPEKPWKEAVTLAVPTCTLCASPPVTDTLPDGAEVQVADAERS